MKNFRYSLFINLYPYKFHREFHVAAQFCLCCCLNHVAREQDFLSLPRPLPMAQTQLPQELHDMIMDFAHPDKSTISQCGLVCRSWLPTSRFHLFYNLELVHRYHSTSKKNFKILEPLLNPQLWPHPPMGLIHSFSITTRTGQRSEGEWVNTILSSMPDLPKLKSLSLSLVRWQDVSPNALQRINSMLPQLHSLQIRCSSGITIADLRKLVQRPSLHPWKELELRVYLEDYTRKRLWIYCSETRFRLTASDPDHDAKVEFACAEVWHQQHFTAKWTEIEFSVRWDLRIYEEFYSVIRRLASILRTLRIVVDLNSTIYPSAASSPSL